MRHIVKKKHFKCLLSTNRYYIFGQFTAERTEILVDGVSSLFRNWEHLFLNYKFIKS